MSETTALTRADRQKAVAARAAKRGAAVLPATTRSTGGGGKFEPLSMGRHYFQFGDVLDVTYAPSEYLKPDEAPRPRVVYALVSDELEEDGRTPKVLPYWTATSIYDGDKSYKPGGLLVLIRKVTGIADLDSKKVIERWGDEDGTIDPQTLVYPMGADGTPRPGWVFSAEVQHREIKGRGDRTFNRAELVFDSIKRVTAEEYKANAHLADHYVRPTWFAGLEASVPPEQGAEGAPGIAPDPVETAKPVAAAAGGAKMAKHDLAIEAPPNHDDEEPPF